MVQSVTPLGKDNFSRKKVLPFSPLRIVSLLIACLVTSFFASSLCAEETYKRISSKKYHWQIIAPIDWTVNKRDPSSVMMTSQDKMALCGVHSGFLKAKVEGLSHTQLRDFVDRIFDSQARSFFNAKVLRRKNVMLPSGASGLREENSLGARSGGRSLRLYTVSKGIFVIVDCEARSSDWNKLNTTYEIILKSFDFTS
jgi:hypothetical protein